MNSIDIAILTILGLSCLMGIFRGLTKEVLGLFTWVGSAVAAYALYPSVGEYARSQIANPMIADSITGVCLFIAFLILFSIIAFNISNMVRGSVMGSVDRGLGLAFGIVRGVVIICIAEITFSLFIPRESQSETIKSAQYVPIVRRGADEFLTMLPSHLREIMDQQSQKLQGTTNVLSIHNAPSQLLTPLSPKQPQSTLKAQATPPLDTQSETQTPAISPAPHHKDRTPASPQSKYTPVDPEKTAESLSQLKPKASISRGNEGVYDKRQQRELDRLIDTLE